MWLFGNILMYNFYCNKVNKFCKLVWKIYYENNIFNIKICDVNKWWKNVKIVVGLLKFDLLISIVYEGEFKNGFEFVEIIVFLFCKVFNDLLFL